MATNLDPNQQTIEQALNNILGHTKDIANLMRAKEAAELALRGGAPETVAKGATKDLLGASGLSINDFRDSIGHFKGYASLIKNLKDSFKTTATSVSNYNKVVKSATTAMQGIGNATKKATQAINYQYSIGRGKFVVPTPFQAQRAQVGGWADFFLRLFKQKHSVGFMDHLKERSLDENYDFKRNIGYALKKGIISKGEALGLGLGRVASGASSLGWFGAAGVGAAGAIVGVIGAQIARTVGDALKTGLGSAALSMGLQARGAEGWTTGSTMASIYGLRRMGLSTDAAMQAITQGQAMGLGAGEIRSAIAAQQALGLSNTMQKAQTLTRRMGWGQDVSSYFRSLEPITRRTRLSMEELSNATEEFASNLRGAMDPNTIRGLMERFGGLVRTKALSWGEVANIAMAPQGLAPNQQMAVAHFAAMGGYRFKHSSLLGQAYEMQRMGPTQMGNLLNITRSALRGMTGGTSWNNLSDEQKYMFGNMVAPIFGLGDFYKLPQGEEIMQKILSGTYTDAEMKEWQSKAASDTSKIAESMHLIQEPLTSINTMLAGWISKLGAEKVGDFAKSTAQAIIDNAQNQNVNVNLQLENNVRNVDLILAAQTEGHGAKVEVSSGANPK